MNFIFLHTHPIQYFSPLYKYLTEQGLPLQVWYFSPPGNSGQLDKEFATKVEWDIPLLEGYAYRFFNNSANPETQLRKGFGAYRNPDLIEALKKEKPAYVVVTGWNYWTFVQVLLKARSMGHTLLFRGETNWAMERARPHWQRILRKPLLNYLLKNVDRFLYIGQQSKAFYRHLGIPESKLIFTPYAVDNQRFLHQANTVSKEEARKKLGLPLDGFIFLFSGKYIAKKRPMDLLTAFAAINHTNAVLVMMGEGELRVEMENFVGQKGLQHKVWLTGFVNQSAVGHYYKAADVIVMCSNYGETWGLSINEAMNFSLPIIASDRCGCASDLVKNGENGFVYTCGDTAALAQLLQQFIQMQPPQLAAMGSRSLQKIEAYSFEKIFAALQTAK